MNCRAEILEIFPSTAAMDSVFNMLSIISAHLPPHCDVRISEGTLQELDVNRVVSLRLKINGAIGRMNEAMAGITLTPEERVEWIQAHLFNDIPGVYVDNNDADETYVQS
jgi:hypothetical protein